MKTSIIALTLLVAVSCSKKEEATQTGSAEAETATTTKQQQPAEAKLTADQQKGGDVAQLSGVKQALDAYESIRQSLVEDKTADIASAAKKIAESARQAASKASGDAQQTLEQMAQAATELQKKTDDIEAAREAFGEVSRSVVALVIAYPELQQGRHVFECPMAKGYTKWVQSSEQIDNPYMGQKMLQCGSEVDWKAK